MADFKQSSLWRVSKFNRLRSTIAAASHDGLQRQTLISSTLQAELRALDQRREGADALEVVAACVRLREPALIYLRCDEVIWPVTLFPSQMLYHSPRSLGEATLREMACLKIVEIEPAGVRPPGHFMGERVANAETYHALTPALWQLALQGPRTRLLREIAGTAAYRVLRDPAGQELPTPGALAPAVERLRRGAAPLRSVAGWPGMSLERASRLLNALYLTSNLMVSRTHHSARSGVLQWLLSRRGL
jgi:hypothetical protein